MEKKLIKKKEDLPKEAFEKVELIEENTIKILEKERRNIEI